MKSGVLSQSSLVKEHSIWLRISSKFLSRTIFQISRTLTGVEDLVAEVTFKDHSDTI